MTITSVVSGDGPEGGWDAGHWDWAKDAAGSSDIRRGNNSFMIYLDSNWFLIK
jgi:hypothetical protein